MFDGLSRSAHVPVKLANPAQSSFIGIRPLACHIRFVVAVTAVTPMGAMHNQQLTAGAN